MQCGILSASFEDASVSFLDVVSNSSLLPKLKGMFDSFA